MKEKIPIKNTLSKLKEVENSIEEYYENGNDKNVDVFVIPKKKYPKTPDFVYLFQAVNMAISKTLTPAACKLLLYMISKLQYGNHVGVNIKTMMEDLELCEKTVITATNQLKQLNIILPYKDPSDKRRNVYMFHPLQSWRGSFKERFKVLKKLNNNKQQLCLPWWNENNENKSI